MLDTVAQIRKCGLESILSLPQLAVCGDQSAGKSSVLEALTEIPFPRADNLCTRFATEIILRRATSDAITIKIIPDANRPAKEQELITAFKESISDFSELPSLMNKATALMGIADSSSTRAFAKDVLSVEIQGPLRPQLTLVDLPGLIQNETKGVKETDIQIVKEITEHYISQPRTICLAVISATNDYANQGILTKVRKVDPEGERTLGIITKPDRLSSGSGSEKAFMSLAKNEDIFFRLGWHVLRNRTFEDGSSSFEERNAAEALYFRTSNFKTLPKDCVGVDSLRTRLSQLLFDHVKQELPKLREDLDSALVDSQNQLKTMGNRRVSAQDCRAYLASLSLDYHEICKAAVDGHYEGDYFNLHTDDVFSPTSPATIRRLRAVVQYMNTNFSKRVRTRGYKYHFTELHEAKLEHPTSDKPSSTQPLKSGPKLMSNSKALEWIDQVLKRTRGKELSGNFNPLLIGELFWEQSSNWRRLAEEHVESVSRTCSQFLESLLEDTCPKDIQSRLWSYQIRDALKDRSDKSFDELHKIMEDIKSYPINYNHYYTDTINKKRQARNKEALAKCVEKAGNVTYDAFGQPKTSHEIDVPKLMDSYMRCIDPDMEKHSCEEALDCLFAIYKVCPLIFFLVQGH